METITALHIPFVENHIDSLFIQHLFYYNNIATIKNILFLPSHEKNFKQAILDVYSWHNTNYVYDFISRLHNYSIQTCIYYDINKYFSIHKYSIQETYLQFTYKITYNDSDNDWRNIEIALYNNHFCHNLLFY